MNDLADLGIESATTADEKEWTNDAKTPLPPANKLLIPWGWKLLIMPMRPEAKSQGGILIPQVRQDLDTYLSYVGRIVALGPACYKNPKYRQMGMSKSHFPKRGDWVVYPINSYQRIDFKGTKLILTNDDQLLGIIPKGVNPWDFKLER